jgi:hypothetical protein
MRKYIYLFSVLVCSSILNQNASAQIAKKKPVLRNNITLTATGGFEIDSAYLAFEDGERIPNGNVTEVNKKIVMWIIINKGWKETNGKVKIGAAENILTDKGVTVLKSDELFPAGSDEGTIEDARYISLKAVITSLTRKIPYFVVKFRVWDKNGTGKISGSYRFKVKQ